MRSVSPPPIEKNQKETGMTLSFLRSEAIHCTRNRIEKNACPRNPTDSQSVSVLMSSDLTGVPQGAARSFRPGGRASARNGHARRVPRRVPGGLPPRRLLRPCRQVHQLPQWHLERDGHSVEAVHGDGLLPALDLADELPAEVGVLSERLLAQAAIAPEQADLQAKGSPDMRCASLHLRSPPWGLMRS